MENHFLHALLVIIQPMSLLLLFTGAMLGLICGVIPGLSGSTALILLMPITYGMSFEHAMVVMMSASAASTVGGAVTSILLGVPGQAMNAATVFDGFPLARQGRGVEAVACAASSSTLGGLFGVGVLLLLLPVMRSVVLAFGPAEFLVLVVWGLVVIASVSGKSLLSGLIAAIIGLLLSFVGFNSAIGGLRFTFGIDHLWDGFALGPTFIGLFAIASAIDLAASGEAIVKEGISITNNWAEMKKGLLAPIKHFDVFIRGSLIGTFIGIVPGVGGVVASFLAYGQAVQFAKDKSMFGKGDIRGVVGPESANNAKDGGALVPTIAFGIPGSEGAAILLGAFLIHGIVPGEEMLGPRMWQTWVIILVLVIATILGSPIAMLLSRSLVKVTKMHPAYVAPLIILVSIVGSYSFSRSMGDLFVTFFMAVLGYLCVRLKIPREPLVISYILGVMTERYFFNTMQIGRGSFFGYFLTRPIAIGIAILVILSLAAPAISAAIKNKRAETTCGK